MAMLRRLLNGCCYRSGIEIGLPLRIDGRPTSVATQRLGTKGARPRLRLVGSFLATMDAKDGIPGLKSGLQKDS